MTDIEKLAQKILKELLPGGYTRMDYENITRHLTAAWKERDEMDHTVCIALGNCKMRAEQGLKDEAIGYALNALRALEGETI